jgi:dihydrofolate reductase
MILEPTADFFVIAMMILFFILHKIKHMETQRRLSVFNNITLDGYFTSKAGDMSWAHKMDPEWTSFTNENAKGDSVLVFGRVTYEMMEGFWPTPNAAQIMPDVANKMNSAQKIVFSNTMDSASWNNTRLVKGNGIEEMRRIKQEPGNDLIIFGSGKLVAQLAQAGLVDEYQVVLCPVAIGGGRSMFEGISENLQLVLTKTRSFGNSNVFLTYEPVKK